MTRGGPGPGYPHVAVVVSDPFRHADGCAGQRVMPGRRRCWLRLPVYSIPFSTAASCGDVNKRAIYKIAGRDFFVESLR